MIDILLQTLELYPLLFFGVVISEVGLILLAIRFMSKSLINRYDEIQKIHHGQTSRLGGFCIFIALFIGFMNQPFFFEKQMIYSLFFCFLPILLITIFEDMYIHTKPLYRMLAMALASFLLLFTTLHSLPELSLPFIGPLLNETYILTIFYAIALIGLMNGMNFIDGANGLLTMTLLSSFFGLGLIAYCINDHEFLLIILFFSIPLFIFLLFNYPWGKIFMGDVGAYWFGWVAGTINISFFSRHEELLTWSVPLLLFYPAMEVFFSFLRKISQKKSPFHPDDRHLHLIVFFLLNGVFKNQPRRANNFVMPFLTFFWLTPPLLAALFYQNLNMTLLSLGCLIIIYFLLYRVIPKKSDYILD